MAGLRWILLAAGALFLIALAWWERRRPRQASRDAALRPEHREPTLGEPALPLPRPTPVAPAFGGESELILPVLQPPAVSADAGLVPAAPQPEPTPELVVEYPPEAERQILNLRLLPLSGERFSGRSLRQALLAGGFVYGRFGIFHQPDDAGRAVLSVASLSRPGILDPDLMDFQRFPGISLFAVLPGPLPPTLTLERLVSSSRELAQRLDARVQDEHGAALDAARVEAWRRELTAPGSGLSAEPAA